MKLHVLIEMLDAILTKYPKESRLDIPSDKKICADDLLMWVYDIKTTLDIFGPLLEQTKAGHGLYNHLYALLSGLETVLAEAADAEWNKWLLDKKGLHGSGTEEQSPDDYTTIDEHDTLK